MNTAFFKNWDTKTCLWLGMIFFALLTGVLAICKADKDYVVALFALTGQLVAGLLTYVNSHVSKTVDNSDVPPVVVDNTK